LRVWTRGVQATPYSEASSVRRSSLLRSIAVAILVALTVLGGTPFHSATPSAQAANGMKAVVIVGPAGDSTSFFLDIGAKLANQAEAVGFDVRRIFHPRATTERVLDDLPGANLVVYLGHGNGWPSPYGPFQERTKNGFGLNPVAGGSQNNHVYRGANWIRNNIALAPNAVAILIGACYASGNGEPGMPIPSKDVAKQRVDNFAAGFLDAGAGAVFAFGWDQRANYPSLLATSNKTMDEIFMTRANGSPSGWVGWNDDYLSSERTPGAKVHLDPHPSYGYYRALTGDMGMTAAEFRGDAGSGSESGGDDGAGAEPGAPLPDTTAPSAPDGLAAENTTGRKVALSWQASTDDQPTDVRYRVFRNGRRVASGVQATTFTDTVGSDGSFRYQVAAVDAAGNVSAKSTAVAVQVGGGSSSASTGPTVPTELSATSLDDRRVRLSWQASQSTRAVEYVVFRDGTRIARTSALSFTDRPDRVGTYSYRVRAVDAKGNKSAFTPEVEGVAVKDAAS
jgi:hypothetical protein